MKFLKNLILLTIFLFVLSLNGQKIEPPEVKKIMEKVADWQIENHNDLKYRAQNKRLSRGKHHMLDWTNGALYVGMSKWAKMADTDKYYEWLKGIGQAHEWKLHMRNGYFARVFHADDHTVGQTYFHLFRKYKDDKMIKPTINQFDFILYHPSKTKMDWKSPFHQDRWNWCDALFMSPPVWVMVSNLTRDRKYIDFMVKEWKATTNHLFDKKENLYYRDGSYFDKLDNGTKIFWGRGNGWVFAGLSNVMDELGPSDKDYPYFLKLYKKMAKKLLEIQTPEGHWAMSLLGQEFYPTPETSGSSFFIFGLAWGINNGILDREIYGSAVQKGWNAMVSYVNSDGMLGYVQAIGAEPGEADPDKTEVYGVGAFLSAGSEVYKLYGGN
jgi:rhamnogalacturonyl hydrolase YesR